MVPGELEPTGETGPATADTGRAESLGTPSGDPAPPAADAPAALAPPADVPPAEEASQSPSSPPQSPAALAPPGDFPPPEHHRDIQGGSARAAVFGISDGLVTNVALILGIVGAHTSTSFIRLAGLAGLVSGAFSMAAGEYVSMQAQRELLSRELDIERRELARHPSAERRELAKLYEDRGLEPDLAAELAQAMMRNPEIALETHAREELGINPEQLGSPWLAAGSSLVSFAVGAVLPLLPWFFSHGTSAALMSIIIGAIVALVVGAVLASFTGRPPVWSALRQLLAAAVAAAVTFAIGSAVGVT